MKNLLALSLWILDAQAFSWKQKPRPDSAFDQIQVSTVLRAEAVLAEYIQRSDCFRHAAGQIRVRCAELDMDERERVRAAISMTLCELATAKHYSTPLECVPFSVDHNSLLDPSECVDALSRSAQFWSSYSGYLREIPQLCFAFRRWNDIDTARDVYKNATLEKIELIRALLEREEASTNHLQTWNIRLSELQDFTSHMETLSDNIVFTLTEVSSRLVKDFDAIRELSVNATSEFLRQSQQHTLQQIDASLTDISKTHAHALENAVSYFHQVFHVHLQSLVALSRSHNQVVLDLAVEASDRIQLVNQDIFSLHESTVYLSRIANQTIEALHISKYYMQDLHQAQTAAVLSTNHAVDKITQLTNLTQDEFQRINTSAFLLKQALNSEPDPMARWWNRTWPRLVQLVLNIDSQQLAYVPVFQSLSFLMGPIFYVFRSFLSLVMAVFVFLLSSKRYTSKNVPAPGYHPSIQVHQPNPSRSRRSWRLSRIPDRLYRPQV